MANSLETLSTAGENVSWQLVDKLEEQRQYPRIPLEIPVAFRNSQGQHCAARLLNVSPDGMQVRCNVVTAQILHPGGGRITADNQPILQATLAVPFSTGAETLSLGVRLLYLTNVSDEPRCVLGFNFLSLRPKARRIIDGFFSERLRAFYDEEAICHVA